MKTPKIVHVLANGKRVKSIEGHVIPADNPVYSIIIDAKQVTNTNGEVEKLA